MGCNNNEELSCGDLYRQYSVMEAGWTVFQCSFSACFSVEEDHCVFTAGCVAQALVKFAQQVKPRRSQSVKTPEIPPRSQARRESVSVAEDGSLDNVTVQKNRGSVQEARQSSRRDTAWSNSKPSLSQGSY